MKRWTIYDKMVASSMIAAFVFMAWSLYDGDQHGAADLFAAFFALAVIVRYYEK